MKHRKVVLIAHDIRSCYNVGSLMRSAEGLGASHLYLTGYTPYPQTKNDTRLPHISAKLTRQIHKTALGAEQTLSWSHHKQISCLIKRLRSEGFQIAALEQSPDSYSIIELKLGEDIALLVGNETKGLDSSLLEQVDICLEIPMQGQKESFNVTVAAAIALYHLGFFKSQ